MQVVDRVNEHAVTRAIELLVKLAQLVELRSRVEVAHAVSREVPLEALDEVVVLGLERVPVEEVTSSQTDTERFACIGGTNTSLSCANHL